MVFGYSIRRKQYALSLRRIQSTCREQPFSIMKSTTWNSTVKTGAHLDPTFDSDECFGAFHKAA